MSVVATLLAPKASFLLFRTIVAAGLHFFTRPYGDRPRRFPMSKSEKSFSDRLTGFVTKK